MDRSSTRAASSPSPTRALSAPSTTRRYFPPERRISSCRPRRADLGTKFAARTISPQTSFPRASSAREFSSVVIALWFRNIFGYRERFGSVSQLCHIFPSRDESKSASNDLKHATMVVLGSIARRRRSSRARRNPPSFDSSRVSFRKAAKGQKVFPSFGSVSHQSWESKTQNEGVKALHRALRERGKNARETYMYRCERHLRAPSC